MKKFEYEIAIPAATQEEADRIMKAIVKTVPKLTPAEWTKIAEVVSNPMQLSLIKAKLGL